MWVANRGQSLGRWSQPRLLQEQSFFDRADVQVQPDREPDDFANGHTDRAAVGLAEHPEAHRRAHAATNPSRSDTGADGRTDILGANTLADHRVRYLGVRTASCG